MTKFARFKVSALYERKVAEYTVYIREDKIPADMIPKDYLEYIRPGTVVTILEEQRNLIDIASEPRAARKALEDEVKGCWLPDTKVLVSAVYDAATNLTVPAGALDVAGGESGGAAGAAVDAAGEGLQVVGLEMPAPHDYGSEW